MSKKIYLCRKLNIMCYYYLITRTNGLYDICRMRYLYDDGPCPISERLPFFVNKNDVFSIYYRFFKHAISYGDFRKLFYKKYTRVDLIRRIVQVCFADIDKFDYDYELKLFKDDIFSLTFLP